MSQSVHRVKLQAQGRIVLPKKLRADLRVEEGDELLLVKNANEYILTSRALLVHNLYGGLKKSESETDTENAEHTKIHLRDQR